MQNVEALREVKRAEAEVRQLKEQATRQAGEILREAERKATELIEQAKAAADAEYAAGIKSAQDAVSKDRQKVIKSGESQAQQIVAKASSPDFNKAVEVIVGNFDKRVSGK